MSSSQLIPSSDGAAVLCQEFDRWSTAYPSLCHIIAWPESGWGFDSNDPSKPQTIDDRTWQLVNWTCSGTRWRYPAGWLLIDGNLVAASFFEDAPASAPADQSLHDMLAHDHRKTCHFADAIGEFTRLANEAVQSFGIDSGSVNHPRRTYPEDRWVEHVYSVLAPSVEKCQSDGRINWLTRRLPTNVFTASSMAIVSIAKEHVEATSESATRKKIRRGRSKSPKVVNQREAIRQARHKNAEISYPEFATKISQELGQEITVDKVRHALKPRSRKTAARNSETRPPSIPDRMYFPPNRKTGLRPNL